MDGGGAIYIYLHKRLGAHHWGQHPPRRAALNEYTEKLISANWFITIVICTAFPARDTYITERLLVAFIKQR